MSAGLGKGETHEQLGNQGRLVNLCCLALAGRRVHLSSRITQLNDVLHDIRRGSSLYLPQNSLINIQVVLSQSGTSTGVPTCSNPSRPTLTQ